MVGLPSIWIFVNILNLHCNIVGFPLSWISLKSFNLHCTISSNLCLVLMTCTCRRTGSCTTSFLTMCPTSWRRAPSIRKTTRWWWRPAEKRTEYILNSDRTENQMLQIAPNVLLSEIVPGRGHRLCKSSQLQRALRRVIYGWQRISKVKISRFKIFVLSQMDFCLQGSQRAYFWLRWTARSGKTISKPPLCVIRDKKSKLLSI